MPLEDAFIDQAAARPVHEMLVHEMLQRIGRNSSAELGPDLPVVQSMAEWP